MPETREPSARLRALYENYLDEVETAERNRKLGAGWFGMKGGVADDPCHDRFAEALRSYFEELSASGASGAFLRDELSYVYTAPRDNPNPRAAYWMLIAVQGYGIDLIGYLEPADAQALAELFHAYYPRRDRMPVQTQILKRLKQQAH